MKFLLLLPLLSVLFLTACSTTSEQDKFETYPELDARELYQAAQTSLMAGNFTGAVRRLEALDLRYPFGAYSQQSQLDLIYAYHKLGDTENALTTIDRFIRQNPRHPNVDYAYYMKGLVKFNDETSFLENLFAADLSQRDASSAREAFEHFSELMRRFPESKYAADARQRMIYLRNRLAEYEIHVARFYMSREAYLAAANRAKYVVEHFPQTPAVKDALSIMITAYDLLEMSDLAEQTRKVLQHNYSNTTGA
ncbi:MAG: outer membrane protein assembly factor BamD [Gammaproteobacteria bacterium]|jgi:outer membrane protein assembly factor BamD